MSHMLLVARQELLLAARSRWLQIFTAVFATLALLVASSGYVRSGGYGVQDFARTAESLVQLVLLLVPLTAITFGALTFVSERGAAELMYSQPIARSAILCGRYLGLFVALASSQCLGFGIAASVINQQAGDAGGSAYLLVVLASIALTAVFLSIAAWIAQTSAGRAARALAVALVVWFAMVILYDVAVLGTGSMLRSGTASRLLVASALVNPVDAIRTATLIAIEGTAAFGAASLTLLRLTGGPLATIGLACLSIVVWTTVPLWLGVRRLARADI